jgi:hypothetical protein
VNTSAGIVQPIGATVSIARTNSSHGPDEIRLEIKCQDVVTRYAMSPENFALAVTGRSEVPAILVPPVERTVVKHSFP